MSLGDPGDTGQIRPVPDSAGPSYMCPGIHTSTYAPGNYLTVQVNVRNFGNGNSPSLAQVTVWWGDPATGFVADPAKRIGFDVVKVEPRGEQATTLPMTAKIPASAPGHICLLARVSHQLDLAGKTPIPGLDQHWAQRNLVVATAEPGIPIIIQFAWRGTRSQMKLSSAFAARLVPTLS